MKKLAIRGFAVMLCICIMSVSAYGAQMLVPVGQVIGLELSDHSVTVASFDQELGKHAQAAGLCVGDQICAIDGKPVTCAQDIRDALTTSKGLVTMRILRKNQEMTLRVTPQITPQGPKLGLYLKQGVTGIGTVTWYDPETGAFGALGHGVNGADGKLFTMLSGTCWQASVGGVKVGRVGEPGQLRGSVTDPEAIGTIRKNTPRGIFGKTDRPWQGQAIPVAESHQIKTGPATILSTVSGETAREYSVEILKIYPKTRTSGRNILLRITDPDLLAITGGIVQGMSGSPILQNGKLIGAVTHVLVNDPQTGYGIFIENMLDAAA